MDRIVLAHSGAFATAVAIPWLAEKYRAEIVTVTVDLGYMRELDGVHTRALAMGAARAHVIDAADEFARDFVLPALHAGASDHGMPLAAALARAIIARHVVEIARLEGASRVAHGCALETGDAARFEQLVRSLDPAVTCVALARRFPAPNVIAYARQQGITAAVSGAAARGKDVNLWGRSSPAAAPGETLGLTKPLVETPDDEAVVDIEFQHGVPVSVNGVEMPLVELVSSLDTIAGAHGFGRFDRLDARGAMVCEAPAAAVLQLAHQALQASTPVDDPRASTAAAYVDLIQNGLWFTAGREGIDAVVSKAQEHASGVVRLRLHKGACHVVGGPPAAPAPQGAANPATHST